jgi:hypothetical protein
VRLSDKEMDAIAERAREAATEIALAASSETDDETQRFQMLCQIAAGPFGSCGAQFCRIRSGTTKAEASRATLDYIAGIVIAGETQ